MYIENYPEDSMLRRHSDAAAALDLEQWMAKGPTDSVLQRHWQQLQSVPLMTSSPAPTAPKPSIPEPAIAAVAEPHPRKGLFSWLGRLFGG